MSSNIRVPVMPEPAHRGPTGTGSYFDAYTAEQVAAATQYLKGQ